MFLHLINLTDRYKFFGVARLVCLVDGTLLWDGKRESELTGNDDLSKVSFKKSEALEVLMKDYAREIEGNEGSVKATIRILKDGQSVAGLLADVPAALENAVLEQIKKLPIFKQNILEERVSIVHKLLRTFIEKDNAALPSVPKIMLFELILLALADGTISNEKLQLLREFGKIHGFDDLDFHDLFVCASNMSLVAQKAVSVIFE